MADRVELGSVVYKIVFEQGDVESAARKTASAFDEVSKKATQAEKTVSSAGAQTRKIGSAFDDLGNRVNKASRTFSRFKDAILTGLGVGTGFTILTQAVQGLRNAITGTFDAAVSFESAFAGVRKTVDATEAEFSQLSSQFRNLAKDIPLPVEGLTRIGELAGQLGIKKDDIISFTETIAAIGVTTNLTEEQAATSFARIANIFQTPIEETGNLASAVVELGNNFATTESEIVDFATNVATAGKIAGLSTADVAAISTAFTSIGIEAEAGSTAVSKSLQAITDAVAKGGKDLQDFSDVAGMSAKEFADLWKSDPVKAFDAFIKGLGASGQKGSAILEDLVAGDVRLKKALLGMAQAGDLLTRAIDTSNKAFEGNTALMTEAEKRYATTESRLQAIANRWNDLKISIGNFLTRVALPVFEFFIGLAEAIGGAANRFSFLANALKALGAAFAAYLSISLLGKIQVAFTGLAATITSFKAVLMGTASGITTVTKVLGGLRAAILAITSPIGLVVTAVGLLTFAWLNARAKAEELRLATDSLNQSLSEISKQNVSLDSARAELDGLIRKLNESNEAIRNFNFKAVETDDKDAFQAFGDTLDQAKAATENWLYSLGATKTEVEAITAQLGYFDDETKASKEDMELLQQASENFANTRLSGAVAEFAKDFERLKGDMNDWQKALDQTVVENEKDYKREGKNVAEFTATVKAAYIKHVADSGDLGEAAAQAYQLGINDPQAKADLRKGLGLTMGEVEAQQLALNIKSGQNGKVAGLLWAMGIIDTENEYQAIVGAQNLSNAVSNAFESKQTEIFGSGQLSGSNLVSGIIEGIKKDAPALGNILDKLAKTMGALSDVAPVFAKFVPGLDIVGVMKNRFTAFQDQYKEFMSATKTANKTGGGGGGGGTGMSKAASEEIEKLKALESEIDKNIDLYQKIQDSYLSIEERAKKSTDTQTSKWQEVLTALADTKASVEDVDKTYESALSDITKSLDDLEENHYDISSAIDEVLGKTEDFADSTKDGIDEVDSSVDELTDSTEDFQDTSKNNNQVLSSYEDIQEAVDKTIDKIKDLKDEIADIDEELGENEQSFKENIAEQLVEAEEKVKELQKELSELKPEDTDKRSDIESQIAEQEALIKSAGNLSIDFQKELEEARRLAGLNDIELLADKYEKEKKLLETQRAEKEKQLADELAYLLIIKEQENLIYENQKQAILGIESVITTAYRENMKSRLTATEEFVNKSIELYRQLAEEARKATAAGANLSSIPLADKYDQIQLGEGTVSEQKTTNVVNEFNITVEKISSDIDIENLAEQLSNYIKDGINQ